MSAETIAAVQLPFSFDAALLARDLEAAKARVPWERHFNQDNFFGDWSGIALRGNSRTILTLAIDPSRLDDFFDFPVFESCPNVRDAFARFDCTIRSARFLKLAPGGGIREHSDPMVGADYSELRLHIPVLTNAGVDFVVDGRRIEMLPGQCWYVNVDRPHSVINRGTTDRVHLVFDVVVNDWVRRVVGEPVASGS